MNVCLVCLKRKVKLPLERKVPVCSWKYLFFFATMEVSYFVPFGFGNLKMGSHGSSHFLVTDWEGGEVGKII